MGLGTKNRQNRTAEICRQHLREKHRDKLLLVEEFIVEIEGADRAKESTPWEQFTDLKNNSDEMLERLDAAFDKWLNP